MNTEELIGRLTLREKADLLTGKDFWQTQEVEREGIPSIFLSDGPHGLRRQASKADHLGLNPSIPATCYPTAAAMANSWNEALGEQLGAALGEEASSLNVNVLLGPGTCMKRNPRCGRNFEYFSEDPYLAGKMSASYIRGIQSAGVSACVKHFAANNQEERRMVSDSVMDERTLREIYLTAFEIAVKEGKTQAIMSAYNKINDSNGGERLLREFANLAQNDLNIVVLNFIDMLSHARTESRMIRELARTDAAYRSLAESWFRHSSALELFRRIAETGAKVIVTTDHGTIRVDSPVKVVGDKNTNTNLRYKVGKNLGYNPRQVYEIKRPQQFGLPAPNVSSTYIFAGNNDFFAYPNNYNYYVQYYTDTFQHGGISLEEMLIPLVTLTPKK